MSPDPRATTAAAPPEPSSRRPGARRPLAHRVGRGFARLLAALLGLAVAAAVGAILLLQTDWGRERVRLFALERLRAAVVGQVEVARLRGDFLNGITLEGVSITGPAGEPFVSLKRLEVNYQLGGFLRQRILLGTVLLVEPRIALVQDAQGRWNYLRILPFLRGGEKPEPPAGWGAVVKVRELRIVNGTLGVATQREARRFGPLGAAPEVRQLNGTMELEVSALGRADDRKEVRAQDLSFILRDPAGERLAVRELDARAALTPVGLELERFLLRTPSSELSGQGWIRNLAAPVLDVRFRADPLALGELRGFTSAVPFEGTVRGTVGLAGPAKELELSLEDFALETPRSRITGAGTVTTRAGPAIDADLTLAPFDPADVRLLWSGYPLEQPLHGRLSLRGSAARLDVNGNLAFEETTAAVAGDLGFTGPEPAYDLRLLVSRLDLQDVLHRPGWKSVVNGDFRLAGTGIGVGATAGFSGSIRDSRILSYDLVRGTFQGRFQPGAYEIASLEVALPRSVVRGSGRIPYNYTLDLRLSAVSRNLQDFYPGLGPTPAARFEAEGRLSGPFAGLDLSLTGTADSIAWKGLVADSLQAAALFTDLGRPAFRMAVDGSGTGVDYVGPLAFESAEFHLGFAGDTMGVTLALQMDSLRTAQAHLDVEFGGAAPLIVLDQGAMTLRGEEWRIEEPSGFAFQNGIFRFDDFELAHEEERVAVDGTLSLAGPQDFTFDLRNVSVDDLQILAGVEPRIAGVLNGSGTVGGTDLAPRIAGEFSLAEGRVGRLEVHRLGGRVNYSDRELRLDAEFAPETTGADSLEDPGSILIRGALPVDLAFGSVPQRLPDRPIELQVESRGLSMALIQAFSPRAAEASGPLQFSARIGGRPSAPTIAGEFSVTEGRLGSLAVHRLAGRVDYADRELRLDLTLEPETEAADRLREHPGSIHAAGAFPVDLALRPAAKRIPDRPIDLRIESEGVSLALLRSFSPRLTEASGPMQFSVRLTGSPSAPRYSGEITVRNGAVRVGEQGVPYTGINGTLRFDNDRISFEDMRIASPTGDAHLTGEIALRELTLGDIDAKVRARRFTLIDEDGKELVVDADVDLGGTTQQPAITGSVNVEQMQWPLPEQGDKDVIDLEEAIIYVRAEADTARAQPAPDVWRETLLELDVSVKDDAILRSDRALIVLEGDLSVEKRRGRDAPSIAGDLQVVRGFYSDFGTQFEIQEGEVFFYGTPELNPGLHVIATQTVRDRTSAQDVDVTLTLGGTVEKPTLEVTSNPAYDKSEIFSLLLFGTPSPGQGQEGQFQSTVTRVASRQAALPLQRALVSELNLDLLEIQPGVGAEGTSFRVGKYIASDVFITYTQATGPQRESQFGVQYRLSQRWTIETQVGTRQFGADIFYEFRY